MRSSASDDLDDGLERRTRLVLATMVGINRSFLACADLDRYEYTGMTEEASLGSGWRSQFHPDDMPVALKRWAHCLTTGDQYSVEYRCRSKHGEWKWMLGRAVCMRDKKTGDIEKWYGTCTYVFIVPCAISSIVLTVSSDIHASVESRFLAKRMVGFDFAQLVTCADRKLASTTTISNRSRTGHTVLCGSTSKYQPFRRGFHLGC